MERAVVVGLRARGVDATTALEAGTTTLTDLEQLEFAHSESRVLFSFNGCDFSRIHAELLSQGRSHSGIILASQQRYSIGQRVRRLLKRIAAKTAEEMQNHIEFLSNWG